uniref:inosine/xanthosine triphosphatase n=1 Tax=Amorphochlora amoebiformis TaxID=1561963 RepID=A0A7S0DME9_9EUKA|mmetsp:Transcript_33757/g.54371  ORF Transcript_33757/g.54371 Transcript_33757/m.54371 type:complete len:270 (+) Transcript_33757:404-1213(+)
MYLLRPGNIGWVKRSSYNSSNHVRKFNHRYGFVILNDTGEEAFVHFTKIKTFPKRLKDGVKCMLTLTKNKDGKLTAIDVHVDGCKVESKPRIQVVLASQSKLKLEAARNALKDCDVKGVKAESKIAEQPFGHKETMTGAMNRLEDCKSKSPGADIYIGLENGLMELEGRFYDFAWIIMEKPADSIIVRVQSAAIEFPVPYVNQAKEAKGGFKDNTAGSFIAKDTKCNPKDPHSFILGEFLGRKQILAQAIKAAYGQLVTKKKVKDPAQT